MTYNASVPQNSDSPSIFPAQAQTNFTRLLTVVGADHQFNLSAAANDGYHNLIHMTQQVAPAGALAATGRLYVKIQGPAVQLFYMDDLGVEHQITPIYDIAPFKVSGNTISLASGASAIIYPTPAFDYTGFGMAFYVGTVSSTTNSFLRVGGAANEHNIDQNNGGDVAPSMFYTGTDLKVTNNAAGARTLTYSLMINRL